MLQYTNRVPVVGDKVYHLFGNHVSNLNAGIIKEVIPLPPSKRFRLRVIWKNEEIPDFLYYDDELVFAE